MNSTENLVDIKNKINKLLEEYGIDKIDDIQREISKEFSDLEEFYINCLNFYKQKN